MALLRSSVRFRYAPFFYFLSALAEVKMSFFKSLDLPPEDPLFAIPPLFVADTRSEKVDLSLGIYHDDSGRPVVLECVRQAEKEIFEKNLNKLYLPMDGDAIFIDRTL